MIEKSIKNGIRIYQKRPRTDKNKSIINNSNKINFDWINDPNGYKEIAREADSNYMKNKSDNELKLIKDFITKINNGTINNKNKAGK